MGHIIGLGVSNASDSTVDAVLRRCGISTNHYQGAFTGVSLARFKRIVEFARAAAPASLVLPLLVRIVVDKARSRRDVWAYFRALYEHVPALFRVVPADGVLDDGDSAGFTAADLTDSDAVENAIERVVARDTVDLASWELVACAVSQANQFKPAVALQRHSVDVGGKQVPDCVEVVVREVVEHLAFAPERNALDPARLPGAHASLVGFLDAHAHSDEPARSRAFFALCQKRLPGCAYLSESPTGVPFELAPSTATVLAAVGFLTRGAGFASARELEAHFAPLGVHARIDVERARSVVSEEAAQREVLTLRVRAQPVSLRVVLDPAHRLATAEHVRSASAPRAAGQLLDKWPAHAAFALLRSLVVDGRRLLEASSNESQVLEAMLATRWGADEFARWIPLVDGAKSVAGTAEFTKDARAREASFTALRKVSALTSERAPWREAALQFLLAQAPPMMDAVQLASALGAAADTSRLQFRCDQRNAQDVLRLRDEPPWQWLLRDPSLVRAARWARWTGGAARM